MARWWAAAGVCEEELHRERLPDAAASRGFLSVRKGGLGVRDPLGVGEEIEMPVDCGYACDGHDSRVGGRTQTFKLVSGAVSQRWEC